MGPPHVPRPGAPGQVGWLAAHTQPGFLSEEQEGAQRAWVSCMTQGQGLPHQAQALPEELQELLTLGALRPGGPIHRLQ